MFAATYGATEITHIRPCSRMLVEHMIYNLFLVFETGKASFSGFLLAMLDSAEVVKLVLSILHVLEPFVFASESHDARRALLERASKVRLGMFGLHMTLEVAMVPKRPLEWTVRADAEKRVDVNVLEMDFQW